MSGFYLTRRGLMFGAAGLVAATGLTGLLGGCKTTALVVAGSLMKPDNRQKMHTSIDFEVPIGTPVLAAADGTVQTALVIGDSGRSGNWIEVAHTTGTVISMVTGYKHLDKIFVVEGQKVKRGEVIALSGNTVAFAHYEYLKGPHLSFQVKDYRSNAEGTYVKPIRFWYGGGEPIAFHPAMNYTSVHRHRLSHPVADGAYLDMAKEQAEKLERLLAGK